MKIFTILFTSLSMFLTTEATSLMYYAQTDINTTEQAPILDPELSVFAHLMVEAGIGDLFKGTGPFTGFIPTNEAFDKLGPQKLRELSQPKNKDRLAEILMYHIVPGKYLAKNLKTDRLRTINGNYLNINVQNGEITVNGAKVVKPDVIGPNGAIQEINAVLLP